jgi:hypothetical protein
VRNRQPGTGVLNNEIKMGWQVGELLKFYHLSRPFSNYPCNHSNGQLSQVLSDRFLLRVLSGISMEISLGSIVF